MSLPMGSWSGKCWFTKAWSTTTTRVPPDRSSSVKVRPRSRGIPMASKYPGLTERDRATGRSMVHASWTPSIRTWYCPPLAGGATLVRAAAVTPGMARARSRSWS